MVSPGNTWQLPCRDLPITWIVAHRGDIVLHIIEVDYLKVFPNQADVLPELQSPRKIADMGSEPAFSTRTYLPMHLSVTHQAFSRVPTQQHLSHYPVLDDKGYRCRKLNLRVCIRQFCHGRLLPFTQRFRRIANLNSKTSGNPPRRERTVMLRLRTHRLDSSDCELISGELLSCLG